MGRIHFLVEHKVLDQMILVDDGSENPPLFLVEVLGGDAIDQPPQVILVGLVQDHGEHFKEFPRHVDGR